jgi:alkylresorcinol/alkylpyrone synthase
MPRVIAVGTALPENRYRQEEVRNIFGAPFLRNGRDPSAIESVFHNALVEERYFVRPIEEILRLGPLAERNRIFGEDGCRLAEKAARACLEKARADPRQIDALVFVSTTGFVVPSLDVLLAERLKCAASIRRLPVFGWGCTGGVSGLAQAYALTKAEPKARVLVVALELCSLAYQERDVTPKALIASAIFNDGAAAVLVEGDEAAGRGAPSGPKILAARSHLFPETTDLMGWEQVATGLQVILSPRIPELVLTEARGFVQAVLGDRRVRLGDMPQILSHTGGAKVLSALQEALSLNRSQLEISWGILRRYGNMSSVSVLLSLEEALRRGYPEGSNSLMLAFGPGFSAEGLLLQW